MAKALFTQSADILLSKETSLDAIVPLLSGFEIANRVDTAQEFSGPSVLLPFRPKVNGYVHVDIRNQKWPDHMGDPESELTLFTSWSMGFYGPLAFPGGLKRAQQQLWSWPEGKKLVDKHASFIHITTSYIFGAGKKDLARPADYKALPEIEFVTQVALALLKHPNALMYFNSNGEILRNEELLRESLNHCAKHDLPPLDIWTNIRLFKAENGWALMDTVGMGQLDVSDLEACFPSRSFAPKEVDGFLRSCSVYLFQKGDVVMNGDTMDGPGGIRWRGYHLDDGVCPPPRQVIRWFPLDGSKPPVSLLPEENKPGTQH